MTRLIFIFTILIFLPFILSTTSYDDKETHPDVTITYTLWIRTEIVGERSLNVTAPRNTSFYEVMQLAVHQDPVYSFESKYYPNLGHYISKLAGQQEDTVNNIYWMIYKLPEFPDPANPPSDEYLTPVGVDGILIDDGENYLFWYKHVDFEYYE